MIIAASGIVAIVAVLAWHERQPIATHFIDQALARRGVAARYRVTRISAQRLRLEALSIGDRHRPDLTADWIETKLGYDWQGNVAVEAIAARGVRLRGRLIGKRVTWGAVDKLLPARSGAGFALPAIDADLRDAVVGLTTDHGFVAARIDGSGRLDHGFAGTVLATSRRLRAQGCALDGPRARLVVQTLPTRSRQWATFDGPVSADRIDCKQGAVTGLSGRIEASLGRDGAIGARYTVSARAAWFAANQASDLTLSGSVRWHDATVVAPARLEFAALSIDQRLTKPIAASLARARATPLGPLVMPLLQALRSVDGGLRGAVAGEFRTDAADSALRVTRVDLATAAGGRLTVQRSYQRWGRASDPIASRISARLVGGGFPTATLIAVEASRDARWLGTLQVEPLVAGNARLVFAPVRLAARADGTVRIESDVQYDGAIGGGAVNALRLPLILQRSAAGVTDIWPGCTPVTMAGARYAGVQIDATRLTICPTGRAALTLGDGRTGGVKIGAVVLTGRSSGQPLSVAIGSGQIDAAGRMRIANLEAQLGRGEQPTRLTVATIDGNGAHGRFSGLRGVIHNVPLTIDRGIGQWQLRTGTLRIGGALRVADTAAAARFTALTTQDAVLDFDNNQITAQATLIEPSSQAVVTRVILQHDFGRATGSARLAVRDLYFGKTLQPEQLTRLTLGIVANVQGRIDGDGLINWTARGVTSSGAFSTDALDLAAAFGPVSGVSGRIVFDDLLALSTPPGQRVAVKMVNPGVEVRDGTIAYQLLANQRVQIEHGQWPFAGGLLRLEPAMLDFGRQTRRRVIFSVVGLDAAKFIDQLKLDNIAATGRFDGQLPIVFDATGGRIEGGRIVACAGGGTLAYVGDVSNAQTNAYSKLAFDVLKSLTYEKLAIDLDGALDGEIVSQVRFTGINRASAASGALAKRFDRLPFKFTINVRAPFRGLVGTARGLQNPGSLLSPVQPVASGTATQRP